MPKEIIIMGTGGSVVYCPFDCEVWGVNGAYGIVELMPPHQREKFRLDKLFFTDYLWSPQGMMQFQLDEINKYTARFGAEVISLHPMCLGKHKIQTKRLPFRALVERFGTLYFTSTICYMIAYALYLNTKINRKGKLELTDDLHLKLFGVDMNTTQEYLRAKGGVEFWVGCAMGLGATVDISPTSSVMCPPTGVPYGWRVKVNRELIDPYGLLDKNIPTDEQLYDNVVEAK